MSNLSHRGENDLADQKRTENIERTNELWQREIYTLLEWLTKCQWHQAIWQKEVCYHHPASITLCHHNQLPWSCYPQHHLPALMLPPHHISLYVLKCLDTVKPNTRTIIFIPSSIFHHGKLMKTKHHHN